MDLVEVHVDALELQVRVAVVRARRVDAVLVRDHLREWTRILISGELFRVRNIALFMQPGDANTVMLAPQSSRIGRLKPSLYCTVLNGLQSRSTDRTSQNFAPIWLLHWPPWMCTSSRI